MAAPSPAPSPVEWVDRVVAQYTEQRLHLLKPMAEGLLSYFQEDPVLRDLIRFAKFRIKDPSHLREKLLRKLRTAEANGASFECTIDTLHERVTDLAGIRLLHLCTDEMRTIHPAILTVLKESNHQLVQEPFAYTWDTEYAAFFKELGVTPRDNERQYTSVHYVVTVNQRAHLVCEIQVRSLAEEIWGEVDHAINYPTKSDSLACREQLRALARVTSSCTRLVDSIVRSHAAHRQEGSGDMR